MTAQINIEMQDCEFAYPSSLRNLDLWSCHCDLVDPFVLVQLLKIICKIMMII